MRTRPKVVDKNYGVMAQYSGEHEGTWERDSNAQSQASSPESFRTSSPLYSIYPMCQPKNFIRERSISQNIGKYKGGRSVFLYMPGNIFYRTKQEEGLSISKHLAIFYRSKQSKGLSTPSTLLSSMQLWMLPVHSTSMFKSIQTP